MVYFSYIKSYDGESTEGTFDCNDTDRIALHERVIFFYCPDKVGTTAEKRKGNMNRENKKRKYEDRKSTRLNSSHGYRSRMPSSA